MTIAIILASGIGKRMKAGKNKVLINLGGKPIIYYTISAFEKNSDVKEIVLVSRPEEIKSMESLAAKYKFKKVRAVITGGRERQDSGYNSLRFLGERGETKPNDIVIFHNGANPFVTSFEISSCADAARKYGACAVAHPAKDTIKKVDAKGFVEMTLDRKKLWNMQTPQAIRFDLACVAFEHARKRNYLGTDDVDLVEKIGSHVQILLEKWNIQKRQEHSHGRQY